MARVPESAVKYVEHLNLPDLKRACIMRGMPFGEIGESSIPNLQSWYLKNYDLPVDHRLLEEFDLWCEALLRERGADDSMLSPIFRLSSVGARNEDGEITKRKRIRSMVPKIKRKKERTTEGLFKGTKKAFTYELAQRGLPKAEVMAMVKEKYPDAKDKSIGIWFNRARKAKKNGKP